jgi:hypothetical protein
MAAVTVWHLSLDETPLPALQPLSIRIYLSPHSEARPPYRDSHWRQRLPVTSTIVECVASHVQYVGDKSWLREWGKAKIDVLTGLFGDISCDSSETQTRLL